MNTNWYNGYITDNPTLSDQQRDAFKKGDFKTYLALSYIEDRPKALLFLLQNNIRDRFYWEYAYAYGTGNFHEYIPLLPYFSENAKLSVRTTKEGLVRVFRGINKNSSPLNQAYSWTTNKDVATKFANFKTKEGATILQGVVHPDSILAQIKLRNEQELIIHPNSVKILKKTELYPAITKREIETFSKLIGDLDIEAFLTYGVLKEQTKSYKDYIQIIGNLSVIKHELLKTYGDFISMTDTQHAAFLRKAPTIVPLIRHNIDMNLIRALRNVDKVLNNKVESINSRTLTRFLLHRNKLILPDKVVY